MHLRSHLEFQTAFFSLLLEPEEVENPEKEKRE